MHNLISSGLDEQVLTLHFDALMLEKSASKT